MQRVIGGCDGEYRFLDLPDPNEWLMPGVQWGRFDHALSPAFWVCQAWLEGEPVQGFKLCSNLTEEVVTCLLGGHGAPAEVGLAASARVITALRERAIPLLSISEAEELLTRPLDVNGKLVRYRFARQRARYLAGTLEGLAQIEEDNLSDVELRDALRALPGIGPKTASWVVRNRRASNEVAILDVHIVRACLHMNVFPEGATPANAYFDLERRFLEFCTCAGTKASLIDAVMWATMRGLSKPLMKRIVDPSPSFGEPSPLFSWGEQPCQAATVHETTLDLASGANTMAVRTLA